MDPDYNELAHADEQSLLEWGEKLKEIGQYINSLISDNDKVNHLIRLILEYELLARKRVRIISARRILNGVNNEKDN